MRRGKWKPYVFWIGLSELVGALSGLLAQDGMQRYADEVAKPPLSPPGIVFPIVWAVLYALMGWGAARIWMTVPSEDRTRGITLFCVQLAFNFVWSLLFFSAAAYLAALIWLAVLWVLILAMALTFRRIDRTAALLQIPYLVWVAFAAYLNAGVWLLNR